jgi:hypothetical protein
MKTKKNIFLCFILSTIFVAPVQSREQVLTFVDAKTIQKKAKEFDCKFKKNVAKKVLITAGVVGGSVGSVGSVVLYKNRNKPEDRSEESGTSRIPHDLGTVSYIFKTSIALAVAKGVCSVLSSTASRIKDFYSTSITRSKFSFSRFAANVQIMFWHLINSMSTFSDSAYDVKRDFVKDDISFLDNIRKEVIENYREFTNASVDLCGFMLAKTKRKRPEKESFVCFGINRLMTYQNQCTQSLMDDIDAREDFELSPETQKMIVRLGQEWDKFLEKYEHVVLKA